jgi:hypothetical protein
METPQDGRRKSGMPNDLRPASNGCVKIRTDRFAPMISGCSAGSPSRGIGLESQPGFAYLHVQ